MLGVMPAVYNAGHQRRVRHGRHTGGGLGGNDPTRHPDPEPETAVAERGGRVNDARSSPARPLALSNRGRAISVSPSLSLSPTEAE